jgi:hypothetical protein
MAARLLLVHSPLAGRATWDLVAADLAGCGYQVGVPDLAGTVAAGPPYCQRQAEVIAGSASGGPAILIGHSGAGSLLAPAAARGRLRTNSSSQYRSTDANAAAAGGRTCVLADNPGMTPRCWTCGRFVGACRECGARYCQRCQPMQHEHGWEPVRNHEQVRRGSLRRLLGDRLRP